MSTYKMYVYIQYNRDFQLQFQGFTAPLRQPY